MNKRKSRAKKRFRFTEPRPPKPTKPFRFLDLPLELRYEIYELALVEPEGLTIVSKNKSFRKAVCRGLIYGAGTSYYCRRFRVGREDVISAKEEWSQLIPNLLAVCKQIRSEASSYLYKQPIILEDTKALHTFLAAIGSSNRLILSHIVVKDWGWGRGAHKAMNPAALTALSTCVNLQKLHLDCEVGIRLTPKRLARQIFRDGHYFLEAYGAANGKNDAAIDVIELSDLNLESCYWDRGGRSFVGMEDPEEFKNQFQGELRKLLSC